MGKKAGRGKGSGKQRKGKNGGGKGKRGKSGGNGAGEGGKKGRVDGAERGLAPRGLANIGNTCFFNAVLQNLYRLSTVREQFSKPGTESEGTLVQAFRRCLVHLSDASAVNSAFSPDDLFGEIERRAPTFKGRSQQDSHEVFRVLLDGMIEEERSELQDLEENEEDSDPGTEPARKTTAVERLFGGSLCSTLTCDDCGNESSVTEPFLDLSLALIPQVRQPPQVSKRSPSESPAEKKKKTGPSSSQVKRKGPKKNEKGKWNGRNKRGRNSDEEEEPDELPPTSLVSSQDTVDSSEAHTDDGVEVVSLFDTFALSDETGGESEPPHQSRPDVFTVPDDTEADEAMLCSLFDDVEDIPTPRSVETESAPMDDFELPPTSARYACNNTATNDGDFVSLEESLNVFLAAEVLEGDDRPVCERCSARASESVVVNGEAAGGSGETAKTNFTPAEVDRGLESSSECSDNTIGFGKSDRGSGGVSEAEESLDEAERRRPTTTRVRTRSTKRFSLRTLPPVLAMQLNRFEQVYASGGLRKLRGHCEFPLELDLSKHVEKGMNGMYRLSGVVCHSGYLRRGHYTAFVNSHLDNSRWFHCSDASVQTSLESEVLKSEPYLLFYERVDVLR